jgi:hypothetical protein
VDELEWLRRNAPANRPSPETTRRHRTQLRAAIAEESTGAPSPRRPRRVPPRYRVLLGATAVAALCAAVAVAVTTAGDDGGSRVATPAAGTTGTAAGQPLCGLKLPAQPSIPDGYRGPRAASASDADTAAVASQLVETWTSPTGSIEVRWPSDTDHRPWADQPASSADSFAAQSDRDVSTTKAGGARQAIFFRIPNQPEGCDTVQLTVYGEDAASVTAIFDRLSQQPFVPTENTVTKTTAADALPAVVRCPAEKGREATPLQGDAVASGGFATPEAALTSFVGDRDRRLLPTGYTELQLPDGARGYVRETPAGVVTTVLVAQSAGQWGVARWEASPC